MDTGTRGEAFAEWLGERVAPHGYGGKVSPAELIERMATAAGGFRVSPATVTRWLKGARPDYQRAALAGRALDDEAGALAAAGWTRPSGSSLTPDEHGMIQRDAEDGAAVIYVGDLPDEAQREALALVEVVRARVARQEQGR